MSCYIIKTRGSLQLMSQFIMVLSAPQNCEGFPLNFEDLNIIYFWTNFGSYFAWDGT